MSQSTHEVGNVSAPAFRTAMNTSLQALASLNSGASAPSTTYANMMWYDTANNILKMRSEADDAWINLGTLDQSTNTFQASYSEAFTPVQQGGGVGQSSNKIYIGFDGTSAIKLTLDTSDYGKIYTGDAPGSAPTYAARAWANFGGMGTPATRADGNVSSITDLGVGSYAVNFTTPLATTAYCVTGTCSASGEGSSTDCVIAILQTTTYAHIETRYANQSVSGNFDPATVNVVFFM